MEYPTIILPNTSRSQLQKLQTVQNKALRFVYNTHWEDFITNEQLHNRANIDTFEDRLLKLQTKALNKLETVVTKPQDRDVVYIYSDYYIEDDPYFEPLEV